MSFVHLHLHTEFSLLDGVCRIKELPQYVKKAGQTAVAITDHGVMYGAIDFYRACKKEDIKPIIGCEVYVAPRTRFDKIHELDKSSRHLVLLCRNEEGYRNLCYLVSCAFTEGFYIKPRIDLDLLQGHTAGLIALSGCLSGEIPRRILAENYNGAKEYALFMKNLFDEDSFYLEIQDNGIKAQQKVNQGIYKIHEETGIPLVATNDVHYILADDCILQDTLLCIQTGKTLDDPNRMKFESREFYLKTEEQMRELFPDYPEAIDNTQKIADMCNLEFTFGEHHLPEFHLPPEYANSLDYLKVLCWDGFKVRYGDGNEEYKARLQMEIDMISQMGFVDYFLIVADFIAYAKEQDIPVGPGRGSAAGSMVSYCLYITDVCPMEYSLYFERFLNPERISMPDIDIDFCYQRRGEVIEYVNQKYGKERVAQIVTFGTLAARGAVRDVGRVMNLPYTQVDLLAKKVPTTLHITLEQALKDSPEFKETCDNSLTYQTLLEMAMCLEGMPRNTSTHAAGVVVTKNPVNTYVPLAKNDESIVTQYVMTTLEELGLLKMDFLGLRNLTVLHDASKMIQKQNPSFLLKEIPKNDSATMKMLSDGRTSGVFQMESAGMTSVCIGLKPKDIEDITAIIALYRPGPMDSIPRFVNCKHNPSHITYKHPALEPILSVTYGCIVYQEQVIEIFRRLGGYSLGQADMMRRAISKKKGSEIEKERKSFISGDPSRNISGCVAANIPESVAEGIFNEIFDFANYAFNKAHAVCYAIIAYQTAWFKCHHPKEYMASLLTSILDSTDKVVEYISECKNMDIPILPPDINQSMDNFSVSQEGIRFGLVAIKGVGKAVVLRLLQERAENGLFTSFQQFCKRMQNADLNRRALESLIKCGCFDSLGYLRSHLIHSYPQVMDQLAAIKKQNVEGQLDLFGDSEETEESEDTLSLSMPNLPEYTPQELMSMEKETTGLYLSGHPMDRFLRHATKLGSVPISQIIQDFTVNEGERRFKDGQKVTISGVILSCRTKTTRKNTLMAYILLEDNTSSMELIAFSRALDQFGSILYGGNSIAVMGKISVREDKDPQLLIDSIVVLEEIKTPPELIPYIGKTLFVRFSNNSHSAVETVKQVISLMPGDNRVILYFEEEKKQMQGCVELSPTIIADLTSRLGGENVIIQ